MAGSSLFTRSYSTFPVNGNFSKPKGKPNQIKGKPDQGKVKEFQEFSFRESGLINGLRANPNFFPVASKFALLLAARRSTPSLCHCAPTGASLSRRPWLSSRRRPRPSASALSDNRKA